MFQITSLLLFSVLTSAQADRPTYETAYQKAQEEHKPLLIVIGADWCAACKTLKAQTIDPMQSSGKLQNVIVTIVDKDLRPELAQQLMQGSSLPQLVVFSKGDDGWKKFSLSGLQSERRVQELLERASAESIPRTASSDVSLELSQR